MFCLRCLVIDPKTWTTTLSDTPVAQGHPFNVTDHEIPYDVVKARILVDILETQCGEKYSVKCQRRK
jgi:hypothetical protein